MSDRPIGDSLKRLDRIPRETVELRIEGRDQDVGGTIDVNKNFGKGVSGMGTVQYWKDAGWAWAVKLGWTPGNKSSQTKESEDNKPHPDSQ